ncbi:hypothetical protein BBK82_37915 [Lentzea guizhouensis]|uniref:HD domain-containing protein n=1 Tax=Lentzea guizhouensis TaxID=1586287 RepID=A0A1B2HT51_9PSEU|nr:hypothetical protein [Lentzea guizhouensis]ANZ40907.1 hypothetical protein BBK82_37915 [Lentzea guizhouensis]
MVTNSPLGLSNPDIVSSPVRQAVVDHVLAHETLAIAHHSLRTYFFAIKVADVRGLRRGVDYHDDALFFASVLHDLGLSDAGEARPDRFEVAGADLATEFLAHQGVSSEVLDVVWDAIALHTTFGIADRRGVVCGLVLAGTALDFGHGSDFLSDEEAAAINDAFPRLDINTALGRSIIAQAERNRAKAPHLSTADYFYRSVHGFDRSFTSRWGAV